MRVSWPGPQAPRVEIWPPTSRSGDVPILSPSAMIAPWALRPGVPISAARGGGDGGRIRLIQCPSARVLPKQIRCWCTASSASSSEPAGCFKPCSVRGGGRRESRPQALPERCLMSPLPTQIVRSDSAVGLIVRFDDGRLARVRTQPRSRRRTGPAGSCSAISHAVVSAGLSRSSRPLPTAGGPWADSPGGEASGVWARGRAP